MSNKKKVRTIMSGCCDATHALSGLLFFFCGIRVSSRFSPVRCYAELVPAQAFLVGRERACCCDRLWIQCHAHRHAHCRDRPEKSVKLYPMKAWQALPGEVAGLTFRDVPTGSWANLWLQHSVPSVNAAQRRSQSSVTPRSQCKLGHDT